MITKKTILAFILGVLIASIFFIVVPNFKNISDYPGIEQTTVSIGVDSSQVSLLNESAIRQEYSNELEEWGKNRTEGTYETMATLETGNLDWNALDATELSFYASIKNLEEELQAEEFLNFHDVDDHDIFTIGEAYEVLNAIPEFNSMNKSVACKIAWKAVKRSKCNTKKKLVRQVVKKSKWGGAKYDKEGTITVVAPNVAKFKNEINRLNVLITVLHEKRMGMCNVRDYCDKNYLLYSCNNGEVPEEVKQIYKDCLIIYEQNIETTLTKVLTEIGKIIEKFEDGEVTEEQVKAVMEAELNQLELQAGETDDEPNGEDDSQKPDTTNTTS